MKQATGESLSALMDQQADDLDVQRVLNALGDEDELRQRWRRYHLASAAMHRELDAFASVDLTDAVREQLPQPGAGLRMRSQVQRLSGWLRPAASVAVAASVTAVILGGAEFYNATLDEGAVSAGSSSGDVSAALALNRSVGIGSPSMLRASAVTGSQASNEAVPWSVRSSAGYRPVDLDQADALARQKLNAHLHSQMENASLNTSRGMMPFARAVNYQGAR